MSLIETLSVLHSSSKCFMIVAEFLSNIIIIVLTAESIEMKFKLLKRTIIADGINKKHGSARPANKNSQVCYLPIIKRGQGNE